MAEASDVNVASGCEEKGPAGASPESVPLDTTISRMKLLDTTVDTFLQKLIAAGSYQRFTDCYKRFSQLQPEVTRRIYDKFVTQLQTSIREEIADIKAEGNLEAVLSALDAIVEEGRDRKEPAWRPSGIPEKDLRSVTGPCLLRQRDALQRRLQRQEAENRQLADAVLAGRRQVQELQLQSRARWQAWQALHRGRKELVAVLREPSEGATGSPAGVPWQGPPNSRHGARSLSSVALAGAPRAVSMAAVPWGSCGVTHALPSASILF